MITRFARLLHVLHSCVFARLLTLINFADTQESGDGNGAHAKRFSASQKKTQRMNPTPSATVRQTLKFL